jgi:lysyl-tRNA synthetase class 2
VVHNSSKDLPRISWAAMQAEGFVTLRLPRPLRRRTPRPRLCAHREQAREANAA